MSNSTHKVERAKWSRSCLVRSLLAISIVSVVPATTAQAQSLPQGLTCGLSYYGDGHAIEDNACNGVATLGLRSGPGIYVCYDSADTTCNLCSCEAPCQTVPGFSYCMSTDQGSLIYRVVCDGDWGTTTVGDGYWHQELVSGVTDPSLASSFVLPEGASCGFHHTRNSPGLTCMGYDAAKYFGLPQDGPAPGIPGCPPGWLPKKAFDMSSGYGYWTWCEYQDPDGHSWGQPTVQPLGVTCGTAHNDSGLGTAGECMAYDTLAPGRPSCPPGMAGDGIGWIDSGEPWGIGLGFCTLLSNPLPPSAHENPMCTCPSHCPPRWICDDGIFQCPTSRPCTCPCYDPSL